MGQTAAGSTPAATAGTGGGAPDPTGAPDPAAGSAGPARHGEGGHGEDDESAGRQEGHVEREVGGGGRVRGD